MTNVTVLRFFTRPCRSGGNRPRFLCMLITTLSCIHCSRSSWIPSLINESKNTSFARSFDSFVVGKLFEFFHVEYIDECIFTPVHLAHRLTEFFGNLSKITQATFRDSMVSAIAVVIDGRGRISFKKSKPEGDLSSRSLHLIHPRHNPHSPSTT